MALQSAKILATPRTVIKPNLFIIGAAKCGTNSLHYWLDEHPNVYMSKVKEPNYFCSDFREFGPIRDLASYIELFKYSSPHNTVYGESSVNYMMSRVAADLIYAFNSEARLIVMLRNPVDLVRAYHAQVIRSPLENETNFEVAWSLTETRRRGHKLPPSCAVPALIDYQEIGRLGTQLRRFLSIFSRSQLHLIFLDELASKPREKYVEVLNFLNLRDDGRRVFPRLNENTHFKWDWARRIVASPLVRHLQEKGIQNTGLLKPLYSIAAVKKQRAPLRAAFRNELTQFFKQEINTLAEITGRDLQHWLQPNTN